MFATVALFSLRKLICCTDNVSLLFVFVVLFHVCQCVLYYCGMQTGSLTKCLVQNLLSSTFKNTCLSCNKLAFFFFSYIQLLEVVIFVVTRNCL